MKLRNFRPNEQGVSSFSTKIYEKIFFLTFNFRLALLYFQRHMNQPKTRRIDANEKRMSFPDFAHFRMRYNENDEREANHSGK